jgi:micrococcal nuclease
MKEPFDLHRRSPRVRYRRRGRWRVDRATLRTAILGGILLGMVAPLGWTRLGGGGDAPAGRRAGDGWSGDKGWMKAAGPRVAVPEAPSPEPAEVGSAAADAATAGERAVVRSFGSCFRGGGTNCVVDGDTFWIDGQKVRIADIDTPETHPPRCAEEARLGEAATERLRVLLNAGPVTLVTEGRDTDRYGRMLRVVERDGVSLGQVLVSEGLARPWEGRRRPWCGVEGLG